MYSWLFVYMDGAVREVNVRVCGKGLELLSANGGRFEINQLLFADDTTLVIDSEEKFCRLVSEFGRVCEKRKLRVKVKVKWRSLPCSPGASQWRIYNHRMSGQISITCSNKQK